MINDVTPTKINKRNLEEIKLEYAKIAQEAGDLGYLIKEHEAYLEQRHEQMLKLKHEYQEAEKTVTTPIPVTEDHFHDEAHPFTADVAP